MRVAVIGSGKIGGTLGRRWSRAGHDVVFGVRDAEDPRVAAVLEDAPSATASSVADAGGGADVVVFAIPGAALADVLAGIRPLAHTVIIDATNNTLGGPMNGTGAIRAAAPTAQVFRAFNSLGWENFADPAFGNVAADLFYCGPAGDADGMVAQLIVDVGLRPMHVGDLDQVDVVDSVTRLWFALSRTHGRHLAFKVLGV